MCDGDQVGRHDDGKENRQCSKVWQTETEGCTKEGRRVFDDIVGVSVCLAELHRRIDRKLLEPGFFSEDGPLNCTVRKGSTREVET